MRFVHFFFTFQSFGTGQLFFLAKDLSANKKYIFTNTCVQGLAELSRALGCYQGHLNLIRGVNR